MNWARRMVAGLMVLTLMLAIAGSALAKGPPPWAGPGGKGKGPPGRFSDWNDSYWANESLARLYLMGIIKGDTNGAIAANRPVTHLEAAIMLARYLGLEPSGSYQGQIGHPGGQWTLTVNGEEIEVSFKQRGERLTVRFEGDEAVVTDARGNVVARYESDAPVWGLTAVAAALEYGFLIPEGKKLNVNRPLTRLNAAIMLVKAAGLDEAARELAGADLPFVDYRAISAGLRGYVKIAVDSGLITGYTNLTFLPHKPVTRAEWATLLDRFDRNADISPDPNQVRGTLTGIGADSVKVDDVKYPLADEVWVYIKGKRAELADLKVGDRVLLQLNADGQVQMISLLPPHAKVSKTGIIVDKYDVSIDYTSKLKLQVGSQTVTYAVSGNVVIRTESGDTLEWDDLAVGDKVTVMLENNRITRITRHETGAETVVEGDVVAVYPADGDNLAELQLQVGSAVRSYGVAANAAVRWQGQRIRLTDLEPGDRVRATLTDNLVTRIEVLERNEEDPAAEKTGTISHVSQARGRLTLAVGGQTYQVQFQAGTPVTYGALELGVGALAAGQRVTVQGALEGQRLTAEQIAIDPAASTVQLNAGYDSHSETSLTFIYGDTVHSFPAAANLQFTVLDLNLDLSLLQAGDGLHLTLASGEVSAVALVSRENINWAGTITGVDRQGQRFQMSLLFPGTTEATQITVNWSSSTQFIVSGQAGSADDLQVGQAVLASGDLVGGAIIEAAMVTLP